MVFTQSTKFPGVSSVSANNAKRLRIVQVLLTITALEFFGPILRDYSTSHVFHPTWVGHARVHLVWLLGFMGLSGIVNVYLIWFARPFTPSNLRLSAVWQSCNLGGFWIAYLLSGHYDGAITVPGVHVHIFGYDENVFVFAVLSVVMVVAVTLLGVRGDGVATGATRSGEATHASH
jgi:hypothetical protein